MAERARVQRSVARTSAIALGMLAIGAGGYFAYNAVENGWTLERLRQSARGAGREGPVVTTALASVDRDDSTVRLVADDTTSPAGLTADSAAPSAAEADSAAVASADPASLTDSTPAVMTPPAAPPPATPSATPTVIRPVIAEGRTELGDSVYAVREGETITVHFDTFMSRTRRRDKFDRIVRETLPRIYGARADSLLATVPDGQIAQGGDLIADLPNAGITFELADGSTLALWPRTRPGRDGPLVVAYRATVTR